ncbi:MAG: hypothetical protein KDK30_03145 [Leptospiraceae bacterium]|nr:hypothetical protein [Leptospiraceae bacterium]
MEILENQVEKALEALRAEAGSQVEALDPAAVIEEDARIARIMQEYRITHAREQSDALSHSATFFLTA